MSRPQETIVDSKTGAVLFGPEDYPFSRLNAPGSFFVRDSRSFMVVSSVLDAEKNTIITTVKPQVPVRLASVLMCADPEDVAIVIYEGLGYHRID